MNKLYATLVLFNLVMALVCYYLLGTAVINSERELFKYGIGALTYLIMACTLMIYAKIESYEEEIVSRL